GSMVFANGGSMDQLSVQNGSVSATGGTLNFTFVGPDTTSCGLQIGSASGQTASFTASNGVTINATENIFVGDAAGSTGTFTVTGAGTVVNLLGGGSNRLAVGNFGNGTLNITNGGVINVQR